MVKLSSRRAGLGALLLMLSSLAVGASGDMPVLAPRRAVAIPSDYVPGEVIVKFRPGVSSDKRDPISGDLGLVREERLAALELERYRVSGGDVLEAVRRLRQRPDVLYAEPNFRAQLAATPTDPFYSNVDGFARDLQRWAYAGSTTNGGIRAETAWDLTTGRPDVVIAVIDSGVATTHPDIAPNLWTNVGEVPGNGNDDDGNGFVDDVHGWDFYSNDNTPDPDLGNGRNEDGFGIGDDNTYHGTFVATTAAARGNNGFGVVGAAWNSSIMPIKVFTDDGSASIFHIAAAFTYAADNGADVVNASLTLGQSTATLREAVDYARARDCVLVAAAGNFNSPSPLYPAAHDGVLAVGASGHGFETPDYVLTFGSPSLDGRASFSQHGLTAVDVVAPGVLFGSSVLSVTDAANEPNATAGTPVAFTSSGTSFSSPLVAGLAALIISRDKDLNGGVRTLSNDEIAAIITETAVDLADDPADSPNGGPNWDNHGRVDFTAALARVTGGNGGRTVRLTWKSATGGAPSDLGAEESQKTSDVRRQTSDAGQRLLAFTESVRIDAQTDDWRLTSDVSKRVAEQEPNNTGNQAQTVAVPETIEGQIQTTDEGPFRIQYGDGSSDVVEDFYKFTLTAPTTVSIVLTPGGDSDLDLGMLTDFDGDGEFTLDQQYLAANPASGPRQAEGLESLELPAGSYLVACSIYDDAPRITSDSYTLAITSGSGGATPTGYRVYRATTPNVAATPANRIAQLGPSQLAYVDSNAPEGPIYYVVTALYGAAESGPSNVASPGAVDPNAPAVVNPLYKNGKLVLTAEGSKIVAGSVLVVDNAETFALKLSANGSQWLVKKKTRSMPGGWRVAQYFSPGQDHSLVVVTPAGLRSAPVTFRR